MQVVTTGGTQGWGFKHILESPPSNSLHKIIVFNIILKGVFNILVSLTSFNDNNINKRVNKIYPMLF